MYARVADFTGDAPREITRFTITDDGELAATGEDPARVRTLLTHRVYDPARGREVTVDEDPIAWVKWLPGKLRGPATIARTDPDTTAAVDRWAAEQLQNTEPVRPHQSPSGPGPGGSSPARWPRS